MVAPGHRARRALVGRARHRSIRDAAGQGPWLIIAPHPDDEALGPGGLIAGLVASGVQVHIAFLTDGAGSHVGAPGWSATRVAGVRAQEAAAALRCLGVTRPAMALDWRDAAPFAASDAGFVRSVRRLTALCRARRIATVATTWDGEPHCDHEAAACLASAVASASGARLLYYLVWGWTDPALAARTSSMRAITIPTARWRGHTARALGRHRSQLGGRIAGAPDGFTLPRPMRRLTGLPLTILLEPRHAP